MDRPLAPWLFRIAHNGCIDFMRRREVRESAEASAATPNLTPAMMPTSLYRTPKTTMRLRSAPPGQMGDFIPAATPSS